MHEERFTGRVKEYAQYRTRYPEALLAWVEAQCGLTAAWCVADVGAGTGMLAEMFLASGHTVVAIEPNAEMRAACEQMRAVYPRLRVVDGRAEATGLADASVEMVTVGRALHWFDSERAEVEFRRVLKPGGWVVVVASGRERGRDTAQGRAFAELLSRYGVDAGHVGSWEGRAEQTAMFLQRMGDGAEPALSEFVTERRMGWEEFAGETQSLSVAPLPGTEGYDAMQTALRSFFAEWSEDGRLRVPSVCSAGAARVRG